MVTFLGDLKCDTDLKICASRAICVKRFVATEIEKPKLIYIVIVKERCRVDITTHTLYSKERVDSRARVSNRSFINN